MQRILMAMAVALLMGVGGGCGTGGLRSSTDRGLDPDQALETEIYNRLADESGRYPAGLAINAQDGVVTVLSAAGSPEDQARALAVIRNTPGVTRVVTSGSR
jgi:osmotically-inducible protein OsmY